MTSEAQPRLPLLDESVADESGQRPPGLPETRRVGNLHRTLAHSPAMLRAWVGLAANLRSGGVTPIRLRELAITRVAQNKNSEYVWHQHSRMAIAAGLTQAQVDALADHEEVPHFGDEETLVLAFVDQLLESRVTDETFDSMLATFTPEGTIELLLNAAFYEAVARVVEVLRVPTTDPPAR